MFNSRYDLARFNLSGGTKEIGFSRNCVETIECVAGGRIFKDFARTANENIYSRSNIVALIMISRKPCERIRGVFDIRKLVHVAHMAEEEIRNTSDVSKLMFTLREPVEEILGDFYAGKVLKFARSAQGEMRNATMVGKYCYVRRTGAELILCETRASSTKYLTFTLDTTIPPGGEIRINSDVFTAAMGLENILHEYGGDWIFLTRDTIQINVDSGTGGELTGEIIYNERYI